MAEMATEQAQVDSAPPAVDCLDPLVCLKYNEDEPGSPHIGQSKRSEDRYHDWFVRALTILGHFDPSSVASSYKVDADQSLYSLTLWLEDRIIRTWDMSARDKLRNDFWLQIDDYLENLECPESFFRTTAMSFEDSHWRYNSNHRIRVVYWLISCALSEAYGDANNSGMAEDDSKSDLSVDATKCYRNLKDFPLGFSTGDEQVDRILTILRLRFLMQLQDEQARLNDIVFDLQQKRQTFGKTKSLRSRRR